MALMGTRAIAADCGGVESYENLASRLVTHAHAVTVSMATKHADTVTEKSARVVQGLGRIRPSLGSDLRDRDDDDQRLLTFRLVGEQRAARPPSEPIQTDPARMSGRPRREL